MDCSTPAFPVHHQLPELTQTHIHWIGDAIQLFHPLSLPSPPAFNLSQYQGLFQWVNSLHQVAKGLEFQLQHQCFQMNIQEWFPLGLTGWVFLPSKRLKSFLQHHSSKASTLTMNSLKLMGSLLWFTERGGWGGQDNCSWLCIVAMWELPLFLENKSWGMTFHDIGTSLSNGSEKK